MTAQFRFCPVCGSPLEPRVLKLGEPMRLVCTSAACGFVFYLDPKVAVGTIIGMPDGRIVLVRRAIEPGFGLWVFPGGYVDRGEDVRLAAVREAREEAGIDVRLDELVGIYSYPGSTPVVIVYRATWLARRAGRRRRELRDPHLRSPPTCRGTSWRSAARAKRCGTTWRREAALKSRPTTG